MWSGEVIKAKLPSSSLSVGGCWSSQPSVSGCVRFSSAWCFVAGLQDNTGSGLLESVPAHLPGPFSSSKRLLSVTFFRGSSNPASHVPSSQYYFSYFVIAIRYLVSSRKHGERKKPQWCAWYDATIKPAVIQCSSCILSGGNRSPAPHGRRCLHHWEMQTFTVKPRGVLYLDTMLSSGAITPHYF